MFTSTRNFRYNLVFLNAYFSFSELATADMKSGFSFVCPLLPTDVHDKHSCLWYEQNYHLGDTRLSIFFSFLPSVRDQENGKILLDHCSYKYLVSFLHYPQAHLLVAIMIAILSYIKACVFA